MKRRSRYGLAGIAMLALAAYAGFTVFLALNEGRMVYPGAGLPVDRGAVPPPAADLPWDSLRVQTDDGVPVFLLESRLHPDGPWVIFFHGNGMLVGSPGSLARYGLLGEAGFNVLAVEFRGYGVARDAAEPSERGLYADARAAWRHLTETVGVPPDRIALYGLSLGSGPATYLADRVDPAGLITEGAFTALPDIGQALYPWLPVSLVMRNRFDNLDRARSVARPWLVLHGRHDEVIPFSHGEALAAAAPAARLVPLDAGHNDGVLGDRGRAVRAIRDFVDQAFSRPPQ